MDRAPSDLAELYNESMEVQVTVAKDGGDRTEGDFKGRMWHGYTDGMQIWKPIRIPRNANTVPEYEPTPMTYDLAAHAEGVGMTGWDWRHQSSRWVAFDFDAVVGHSEKHSKKLSEDDLLAIQTYLMNAPTVTIRKSTGGKGLHLYVFLQPTHTENHNEHAAVARAILSQLSGIAGFDFSSKVDICGGNMWVWHRKLAGTDGLSVIKTATQLAEVPTNWRDYTKVVSGRRAKNLPRFIEDQASTHQDIESIFEELTGQRLRVPPDAEHRKLMDWLFANYPSCSWWDAEHHMLVTHTIALKEAHTELGLRGKFETTATGSEKGFDHNCYCFTVGRGAWAIRRYTLGVAEHAFWEQDGAGWTRCIYNRDPDLGGAARIYEGIERPEGGFWFATAETAQRAALLLGADLALPNWILGKPTIVKPHKSGRLMVEIEKEANCPQLPGWLVKGRKFERLFSVRTPGPSESETFKLDERLRHLVGEDQVDAGWTIKSDGDWHGEPFQHVRVYLQGLGYQPKDVSGIMGSNIEQCWRLVNRPFKDEYPRDRQWNRNAAQLRYKPSLNRDQLEYPNWMRVLRHVGAGLDDAIRAHPWCRASGVLTGADWLKCWIASIFQEPTEPLPYIFLYGPQDSGKSVLHEAISLLVTRGVVRADTALTSQSGFNGELENAVLCVVEETNLQKNAVAYSRIKDWVTGKQLPVHKKQRQPYTVQNTTHWVQAANSHLACVTSDTWVQTSDGPRRVGDLLDREVVVLHNSQRVRTDGFYRTGHKPVYRITTSRGYSFKATHDHRALVSHDGYGQWTEVKDLKYGDFLRLHDHRELSWSGDGSFEDGYALGHLVGDGTFKDVKRPVLYLYQDFEVLGYLQLALGDARIFERDTGAIVYSDRLTGLCEQFGLDSKDINDHIQTGSSQFCEGFLSGLFDTDGWCTPSRKKVGLSHSDYRFLQVVQNMLLRLGITSTIVKVGAGGPTQMPSDCRPSLALTITMRGNLERFSKRIGFKIQRKSDRLREALSSWRYSPHDVYTVFATEVVDVVLVGTEDVYDVTVPGYESFSGNGFILHNCPVFPGDTRITMILVDSLDQKDMVPKKLFLPMLEKEAPDFVAELLVLELPPSNDRLNVPCIATEDKALAEYANKTFLEVFLDEKCHWAPGHRVKFGDLYGRFTEWLDPQHVNLWSSIRVGREIPPRFPKARLSSNNEMWIGNISFEQVSSDKFGLRYVVRDGKLVQDELSAVLKASSNGVQAV